MEGDRTEGRSGLTPPEDDPELTDRVRRKDPEAFEEFVRRYEAFVFNVCLRLLGGDQGAVEEVAQEVFLRVWRRGESFAGNGKLSTWLYATAVNTGKDHLRAARKHSRIAGHLAGDSTRRRTGRQPLDKLALAEEEEALMSALAELPEDQRAILVLKHSVGLSYPQISKVLGVSVSALKMRASRAREALRRALLGDAEEGENR